MDNRPHTTQLKHKYKDSPTNFDVKALHMHAQSVWENWILFLAYTNNLNACRNFWPNKKLNIDIKLQNKKLVTTQPWVYTIVSTIDSIFGTTFNFWHLLGMFLLFFHIAPSSNYEQIHRRKHLIWLHPNKPQLFFIDIYRFNKIIYRFNKICKLLRVSVD